MSNRLALPLLFVLVLCSPAAASAQRHPIADRSIAGSLMTAPAVPSSAGVYWRDTLRIRPVTRVEVQHSRLVGAVTTPVTVVGVRRDSPSPDSSGWGAGVAAVRLGIAHPGQNLGSAITAVELQLGVRALGFLDRPGKPAVGFDLILGLSGLETEQTDFSLGIRAPLEWVLATGPARIALSLAPTIAWGHVRFQSCVDDGPGDHCGDLGIQLEFGRTRFLAGGGIAVGFPGSGLVVNLGAQRLLAVGQQPRLALGVAWMH